MGRETPRLQGNRRGVLKALGVGAGLATLGGSVVGQEDGGDGDGTTTPGEDGMDSVDRGDGTVYRVETRIQGPPTNPERPADFFYQPTGVHVDPGDVVQWVFVTPDHNVVSMHPAFGMRRRVPLGVDAFSSPLLGWDSIPGEQVEPPGGEPGAEGGGGGGSEASAALEPSTWLHTFETPGVYDIVCSPHEVFGMAMRVVVGEETETQFETEDPAALPEPRAGPVGLSRVTLTDPALQPSAIVEAGAVEWSDLQSVSSTTAVGPANGTATPTEGSNTTTPPTGEETTSDGL